MSDHELEARGSGARALAAVSLATRARRFARELWIYLLLAALLTSLIAGVQRVSQATEVSALFVGNLWISVLIGASCELGMQLAFSLPRLARQSALRRFALTLPVLLGCALVGAELASAALASVLPDTARLFPRAAVRIVCVPVTLAMLGLALLRDRGERERSLREGAERELEVARLAALATRTEPHFLFNCLNSIAALTAEDPRAAERAVLQLAALFRYVLEGSESREVALAEELAFVRAYLALEQLRFGERLAVTIDADPACLALRVPPLLLQPLVENALRHGLDPSRAREEAARFDEERASPSQLTVAVTIDRSDDFLTIAVDDDGPGPGGSRHRGTGSSHADLRRRLEIAYSGRACFTTSRSVRGGFRAVLRLPRS